MVESPFHFGEFRVPFLYATNGEQIWFEDVRSGGNRSRELAGFHTPAALNDALGRDLQHACAWFAANPNQNEALRPYQVEANSAVEHANTTGKL